MMFFSNTRDSYLALRSAIIGTEKCSVNDIKKLDELYRLRDDEIAKQYHLEREEYLEGG